MEERKKFDVVVVGGGLAGSWVAYWIKKREPSCSVAIIEPNSLERGREGSGGEGEGGEGLTIWETPSMINAGLISPTCDGTWGGVSVALFFFSFSFSLFLSSLSLLNSGRGSFSSQIQGIFYFFCDGGQRFVLFSLMPTNNLSYLLFP